MAKRILEVLLLGDASGLKRELGSAATATTDFAKKTEAANATVGRSAGVHDAAGKAAVAHANALARAGNAFDAAGRKATSFGHAVSGISLATAGVIGYSVKMAADFNTAMESIHTQAGASQQEVDSLKDKVLALAPAVDTGPNQLAQALFHIESAGQRGSQAMATLKYAAEGAAVGHANLTDTTNALVAVLNNAMKGVHGAGDAMAQMNEIVGQGNMHMEDLTSALGTGLLTAAKQAHLSLIDVGAALDVMTVRGIPAEKASNMLTMAFAKMEYSGKAGEKALGSIGITSTQLADDMQKPNGLVVAVQDLKSHLDASGLSASQQSQVLQQAFGGGRTSKGILTLVENVGALQTKTDQLGHSNAAKDFADAWAKTQETSKQKFDRLKADAEATGIKLGNDFMPVLTKIGEDVTKVFDAFNGLPAPIRHVIEAAAALAAVIAPIALVVGKISTGMGAIMRVGGGLGSLLGWKGNPLQQGAAKLGGGSVGGLVGIRGAALPGSSANPISVVVEGGFGERNSPFGTGGPSGGKKGGGPIVDPVTSAAASEEKTFFGSLKSGLAGLLKGVGIAGTGIGVSQLAGSVIGGNAGSKVADIGSLASAGAGIGSFFGPEGIAGGAILGGLAGVFKDFVLNTPTYGQQIGHGIDDGMRKTMLGDMPNLAHDVATTLDKTMKQEKIQPPVSVSDKQFINQERKQRGMGPIPTPQLSPDQEQAMFAAGQKIGDAFDKGVNSKGKFFKTNDIEASLKATLAKLPPQAQAGALATMQHFTQGLEQSGRLPVGATQQIIADMEKQFPGLAKYMGLTGKHGMDALTQSLENKQTVQTVQQQITTIDNLFTFLPKSAKTNGANVVSNWANSYQQLEAITRQTAGKQDSYDKQMHDQAVAQIQALMQDQGPILDKIKSDMSGKFANATASVGSDYDKMVAAATRAMSILGQDTWKMLQSLGIHDPGQTVNFLVGQLQTGTNVNPPAASQGRGGGGPNHAGGGFVQFGRPGDKGRDTIPATVGGANIMVGSGEQAAIFNHQDQQEMARTYPGGLPGFFGRKRNKGLHYMAGGGVIGNYTAMIGEANKIASEHLPYTWGGGHSGSFAPSPGLDCSGTVSNILHAGGLLNSPLVAADFMKWGLPGPGLVTIHASPGHVIMDLGGRGFGTSNSNPGGGPGWLSSPSLPGFTTTHAPVNANTSLPHLQIQGPAGALRSMAQGSTDKTRAAGQKKIDAALQAFINRSSSGGGDWGTFAGAGVGPIVTASQYGGGTTASGANADTTVGFAELSNPASSLNFSALGHLPMGTQITVGYNGKNLTLPKIDVGAGGPGLNGHIRAIDLTNPAAAQLGFSGLADVHWSRAGAANNPSNAGGPDPHNHALGGLVNYAGAFGTGGAVTASKPTLAMFGERGRETAYFAPGGIVSASQTFSTDATGGAASAQAVMTAFGNLANDAGTSQQTAGLKDKLKGFDTATFTYARHQIDALTVELGSMGGDRAQIATMYRAALKDHNKKLSDSLKANLATIDAAVLKAESDAQDAINTALQNRQTAFNTGVDALAAAGTLQITGGIDAHGNRVAPGAAQQQLTALQATDQQLSDTQTDTANAKALKDAQFLVAHSGGQTHIDALSQLQSAQDAIAATQRAKQERQLQQQITDQTQAIADGATIAKDKYADQTTAYTTQLTDQLKGLEANLGKRKISYANFIKDVQAMLAVLGPDAVSSDAALGIKPPKGKPKPNKPGGHGGIGGGGGHRRRHAAGGYDFGQYGFLAGELGPEWVTPRSNGGAEVIPASRSRGRHGGTIGTVIINEAQSLDEERIASKLAFKLHTGAH